MSNFQSLMQKLGQWREKYQDYDFLVFKKTPLSCPLPSQDNQLDWWKKVHCSHPLKKAHPPVMFTLAIVSLTSVVGYRFYNQPQLAVGILSPTTVKAPREGHFQDAKTTEQRRKEVQTGIIPVLQRNREVTLQLELTLNQVLGEIEHLRRVAAPFPFIDTKILSLPNQQYLRSCSDSDWKAILVAVTEVGGRRDKGTRGQGNKRDLIQNPIPPTPLGKGGQSKIQNPLLPLIQNPIPPYPPFPRGASKIQNLHQISLARQRYAKALAQAETMGFTFLTPQGGVNPVRNQITAFLSLSDSTWQATKEAIVNTAAKILRQGIPPGYQPSSLKETIDMHLGASVPAQIKPIATEILLGVLQTQPNLTVDREETKRRAEQAAQSVEPVMVEIKQGEIIVEAGKPITQAEFILLDNFGLSRRETNWLGLGVSGLLVTGSVLIFSGMEKRVHRSLRRRDHLLLFLLSLSTSLLTIVNLRYSNEVTSPLPAVGILASSFYGPTLAITQVVLLSGLTAFSADFIHWNYLLAGAAGGLLAAAMAGRLRSRDELALLGGGVGLLQGGVYFVVHLFASATAGIIWAVVLPGAVIYGSVIYGLLGVAWSVIALGISPYLERFFDLVTPIRLVELSNPNCPLLKRLATEAPGTFQHTLFVACLAEAAARELHCNVELVRAGTLYHDIGKMHDPLGFIENQMGAPNKHDLIDDPWQSAAIIKKHVTEGLVMARKYGLPRMIRDFIPEHQGTLLIGYFYYQAQQRGEKEGEAPILEEDFRYDGPIPQSRETAIVMLADGSEAALRSLKDTTVETALAMIQKIFKARWREGQLKDSGLRYEELPLIAEFFVRVWQQFHHQRIIYPKAAFDAPKDKLREPQGE